MYSHSVDQELMDLSSESRNALKESVFELEDEELALFLNEHHSGVAEEFIDMYGDIDSLIFSLTLTFIMTVYLMICFSMMI